MAVPNALALTFDPSDLTTPGHYIASQTALLLLDFHQAFIDKAAGPDATAALHTAARLRLWARSNGIQVIHCLIDGQAAPFPRCKGFARLVGMARAMATDEPQELVEGEDDGDVTFKRRPGYVSALKSPGLEDFLREKGIHNLFLAGLSTSGCVLRTALAAGDAEFVVTVVADGCADAKKEVHHVALEIMGNRGYVATAEDIQLGFEKSSKERDTA
jgi:nicotinamidase-related amidase